MEVLQVPAGSIELVVKGERIEDAGLWIDYQAHAPRPEPPPEPGRYEASGIIHLSRRGAVRFFEAVLHAYNVNDPAWHRRKRLRRARQERKARRGWA